MIIAALAFAQPDAGVVVVRDVQIGEREEELGQAATVARGEVDQVVPVGLHLGQHGRQVVARELGGLGLGFRQPQLFPINLGQGRAPRLARPVQDGAQAVDHVAVHRRVRRQVELGVLGLGLGVGLPAPLLDRRRHRLGGDGVDRGVRADDGDHPFDPAEEAGAVFQPLALFLPPSTGGEVERHQGGVVQQA
ncbi:hypothetical protein D3C72_1380910 [compost metagenome]